MAQNSVKAQILATIASSAVTTSFAPINGTGFTKPVFFSRIVNDSSEPITISYDGVNSHEYVRAGSDFNFPAQSNSQPNAQYSLLPQYTVVYVKGTAGTGTIALSAYNV
jgi:hypothetical protein